MSEQFKIPAATRSLADRIKAVSPGVGTDNTLQDDGIFRKIATEDGRNVDQMVDDDNYRSDFIAANHLAQAEITKDHMLKHKDVGTVSGIFEIGRNKMEISFDRHQRVPNRVMDKESGNFKVEGEKDLYGDSAVKYKVRGAQNSKGTLKAVREFVQHDFAGAFSS